MTSILDLLNRPQMKKQQDNKEQQEKRKRGNFLVRNAKWFLLAFANVVAIFFDVLAIDGAWEATHDYVLSAMLLLPTGIPLVLWEMGWLYPLASPEQKNRAVWGIGLSVSSAFLIGVTSVVILLEIWNGALFVMFGIGIVFIIIHGILAALYFYQDPVIRREHELQVATSENDFQKDSIEALGAMLDALGPVLEKEQKLRQSYGDKVVDAGIERLMSIKKDVANSKEKGQPNQPQAMKPANAFAAETEQVKPANANGSKPGNPTNGER